MIFGRYELSERLGAGSTGTVFRARHVGSGQWVAVKFLRATPPHAAGEICEVAWRSPSHPNLARVIEHICTGDRHAIAMELVEGERLDVRIATGAPLSGEEIRAITMDVTLALTAVRTVAQCHGDIKPSNVILTEAGAKVVDFAPWPAAGTGPPSLMATPKYAAPEVAAGTFDIRSDLYSTGVIVRELLERRSAATSRRQRRLTAALSRVAQRLTVPDPGGRYPSPEAVHKDLLRAGNPVAVRGSVIVACAAALCLLAAGAAWYALFRYDDETRGASAPAAVASLEYDARSAWMDTGVRLVEGDRIVVHAAGLVSFFDQLVGPSGDARERFGGWGNCPVHSLVGWIGARRPAANEWPLDGVMCLGSSFAGTVSASGRLFIAMNEVSGDAGVFSDNSGAWSVSVEYWPIGRR